MKRFLVVLISMVAFGFSAKAQVDSLGYLVGQVNPGGAITWNVNVTLGFTASGYYRHYFLEEGTTFAYRESSPGVKTNSYHPSAGFNSAAYTQGQLRLRTSPTTSDFIMNYRLLPPKNYNPNFADGYPIIMMIHGFGERGNCWGTSCYHSTTSWNPNTNLPTPANGSSNAMLLNNDHSMSIGGALHLNLVNAVPNGILPNSPNIPIRSWPGFVLFPQNLNGWTSSGAHEHPIRLLRLLMKRYKIDPNRVYLHGLSDGGRGIYQMMGNAPWMFAAWQPMSAVSDQGITNPPNMMLQEVESVPARIFQGGTDGNPTPGQTALRVNSMQNFGMNVKYYLYGNLGHGVWTTAYNETDFFSWMLSKNKANPHIRFGTTKICGTSGAGVTMVLSQGFFAYQWQRDGVTIPGATSYIYTATVPGVYRVRFSRKPNPGPNDWNRWSDPIPVTEETPVKPVITPNGSTVFANVANLTTVTLQSPEAAKYYWYDKNGTLIAAQTGQNFPVTNGVFGDHQFFRLKTATLSGCESLMSDPMYIVKGQSGTLTAPSAFTATAQSDKHILLSWTDNSTNEKGFEIWRRKLNSGTFVFAGRTGEDIVSFLDNNLEAGTTYEYKVRAVSNNAKSTHAPSDNLAVNVSATTFGDTTPPTVPQNLTMTNNTISQIDLSWEPSTDNNGVKQYIITYGGTVIQTNSTATTYSITGLPMNTDYPITVKAEDFTGNQSSPSNQIIGTTLVVGINYEHSTGDWPGLGFVDWRKAEFKGRVPGVNGVITNPYSAPATQEEFFNFKFDGYIYIATAGRYRFSTTSDDASAMYIDDFAPVYPQVFPTDPKTSATNMAAGRVVNNDGAHGSVTKNSNPVDPQGIFLTQGPHRIVVLYYEVNGGQSLRVGMSPATGNVTTDWNQYTDIPNSLFRSGPVVTPPTLPVAPTSLMATANGMTQINLTWSYGGAGTDEFEIYRSTASAGTYTNIGRGTGTAFADNTALPGTTYYYKLKTVNNNGTSTAFSNIANATTGADNVAPSVPAGLTLVGKTNANISFKWTASTDNVNVAGYEILVDNVLKGTSPVASFLVTGLLPNTAYSLTVKAYDGVGNKSAASTALVVTTNAAAMFYSKASGALNAPGTWGTNPDGSGSAPADFTSNGRYYVVTNRTTTSLGGALSVEGSVSRVIVASGTTLNVDNQLNAKLIVEENAEIVLSNATTPEIVSVAPSSTVIFNGATSIPALNYGTVILSGSGTKTMAEGNFTIAGNLSVSSNLTLKGAPGNATKIDLKGNLEITGGLAAIAADNAPELTFSKAGTQTITSTTGLDAFRITKTGSGDLTFINTGAPVTINLGSANGGGLVLNDGSTFDVGANNINVHSPGTINENGTTGKIAIDGGFINVRSESASNSNLYFDASKNRISTLTSDLFGTGKLMIQSPVFVTDGVKIKGGELNAGNGNVTLVSNATATSYLHEIEGNGSVTGKVNVQRWVSSIGVKYRYLSSPVEGVKVADWQAYLPINGNFTGRSSTTTSNMFVYNEPAYSAFPVSSNQEVLGKGVGYSIKLLNGTSPVTITSTGTPHQGDVTFSLTGGSGGGADNGWNLVGNPYASAIAWDVYGGTWNVDGVSGIISVRDNTTGAFKTHDAEFGINELDNGVIAPGQAFWVQAITATPSLTLTERAKSSSSSSLYREVSPKNTLVIELSKGDISDKTYLVLSSKYNDAFEGGADAVKRKNDFFNLSSRVDKIDLKINKLSDNFCDKTVTLNIEGATAGTYALTFSNLQSLAPAGVGTIVLTDKFLSTETTLSEGTSYSFAVTSNSASSGSGRFAVTFRRPELRKDAIVTSNAACGDNATLQLSSTQAGAEYYAMIGSQVISEKMVSDGGTLDLPLNVNQLAQGQNSLRIMTGFAGCSSELLADNVALSYGQKAQVIVNEAQLSVCSNSPVELKASGAPAGGYYKWYGPDGKVIKGETGASMLATVSEMSIYQVAAVTASGCEGDKANIFITPENVTYPVIEFDGRALEIAGGTGESDFIQWYRNSEPLDNVHDAYIVTETPGSYKVLVASNGCSKVSEVFDFNVTGVEETNAYSVYVYPNPGTSSSLYVRIETPSKENAEITLTDINGKVITSKFIDGGNVSGTHRITSDTPVRPGLYIVNTKQGSHAKQTKIVLTY